VGLGGGLGSLTRLKRYGTEWSHAIPDVKLRPLTASGKNPNPQYWSWLNRVPRVKNALREEGGLNGNYVSPMTHALTDPSRNLKGMTASDKLPAVVRALIRTPGAISGAAVGSSVGAVNSAVNTSDCECVR